MFTVALIFNLPYRRFVIGRAPIAPKTADFANDPQVANLRYSRLQVCATSVGNTVNRDGASTPGRRQTVDKSRIGVKKGDAVTNGQVVVLLDDAEYKARMKEVEGRLAGANAAVEKAELDYARITKLTRDKVESKEAEDDFLTRN